MNSVVVGTHLIITLGRSVSSGRLTPDESLPVRTTARPTYTFTRVHRYEGRGRGDGDVTIRGDPRVDEPSRC